MQETQKTLEEMTTEEFEQFADGILTAPELSPETFFTALAALNEDEEETSTPPVELSATVRNGKLIFLEPAPLPVHDNEFRLGGQRIIINFVPESVASA